MAADRTGDADDNGSIDVKDEQSMDEVIPEAPAPKETFIQKAKRYLNPMNYPSHIKKLFKKIGGVIGKGKRKK